jgi:hypothetical protein
VVNGLAESGVAFAKATEEGRAKRRGFPHPVGRDSARQQNRHFELRVAALRPPPSARPPLTSRPAVLAGCVFARRFGMRQAQADANPVSTALYSETIGPGHRDNSHPFDNSDNSHISYSRSPPLISASSPASSPSSPPLTPSRYFRRLEPCALALLVLFAPALVRAIPAPSPLADTSPLSIPDQRPAPGRDWWWCSPTNADGTRQSQLLYFL